jgi:hypothetical protein
MEPAVCVILRPACGALDEEAHVQISGRRTGELTLANCAVYAGKLRLFMENSAPCALFTKSVRRIPMTRRNADN